MASGFQAGSQAFVTLPPQLQDPLPDPPFHTWTMPDDTLWCGFFRLTDGYLLRFPGFADFIVAADATSVSAIPVEGIDDATLDHLFLNQVLPLAMSRRQHLVLHASAVAIDDFAAAFIGPSGQGKSTLIASFATAGYSFLTDDALQILRDGNTCMVRPGPASIRLWQDSSDALLPHDSTFAPVVSYSPKARLLAGGALTHYTRDIPLSAIYVLEKANADEAASIVPCGGAEAIMSLVKNSFLLDIEERDHLTQHFITLSELARLNLVFRLRYPHDFAHLAAVRGAVINHARKPA